MAGLTTPALEVLKPLDSRARWAYIPGKDWAGYRMAIHEVGEAWFVTQFTPGALPVSCAQTDFEKTYGPGATDRKFLETYVLVGSVSFSTYYCLKYCAHVVTGKELGPFVTLA